MDESIEQQIEAARRRIDEDMALLEDLQRQHAEQSVVTPQEQMDSLEAVAAAQSAAMLERSRVIQQAVAAAMAAKPAAVSQRAAAAQRKAEAD